MLEKYLILIQQKDKSQLIIEGIGMRHKNFRILSENR